MEEMETTFVFQPVTCENANFTTNTSTIVDQETDSVIIFNDAHRIPINKALMIERCTFFKYMNKHGFKEAAAKEISINYNTDVTVFKALVDYIHRGKIELTTANLEAVMVAAIYFQLHYLLNFCCNVMMKNTNLKTVGQVHEFAKELALVELRKAAVDFEVKHFSEIAKSKVFYEWLTVCMLELLSSDELEVSHEKMVLKFVFDWLNVDPNQRGEHAAELFRKLRFTFLNEKIMEEVMEVNPNQKLRQILHQVASEFANKVTDPRIYDKGVYMYGYNYETSDLLGRKGFNFVRYCPDDGNITVLKRPELSRSEEVVGTSVVNNTDIFMLILNRESSKIRMEKYDAKKNVCEAKESTTLTGGRGYYQGRLSVCDEQVFAFLGVKDHEMRRFRARIEEIVHHGLEFFSMVYCIKTNTWQRLPSFEGKHIRSATTCGDSIYMTIYDSTNLLQYKPSTGELIDIPCQYDLRLYKAIAYKSSILFLSDKENWYLQSRSPTMAVLFNIETKELRGFDVTEAYKANGIVESRCRFSIFRDSVFVFTEISGKVFKLDLSFNDESKEPTLIPLRDISAMKMSIESIASIQ